MEESQLIRFGDVNSADLELWLTGPNMENYERNPIHLHSLILERSEFFKAKMSERWSSDAAKEIRVTTSHNFEDYITCIQFMYGDLVKFSNVRQCLAVVCVASELLADEIMKKCMQHLKEACCTAEQATQIRDVLSFLGLELLPELAEKLDNIMQGEKMIRRMVSLAKDKRAGTVNRENAKNYIMRIMEGGKRRGAVEMEICKQALFQEFKSSILISGDVVSSLGFKLVGDLASRLHKEEDTDIILEEKVINLMFSVIKDKHATIENSYRAKIYINEILKGNVSKDAVEVCERAVLKLFKSSVAARNISRVRWLSCFILSWDWDKEVKKAAFVAFSEDSKFIKYLNEWYIYLRLAVRSAKDVYKIINMFMGAMTRKEIILVDSENSSFLTTWLPIMAKLHCGEGKGRELEEATIELACRLPQHDRKHICEVWAEAYIKHGLDIKTVLSLSYL